MGKKSKYQELLADINKLNSTKQHSMYVPTAQREVHFSPLTLKQQKEIISTGTDQRLEHLSFTNCINQILIDNCQEDVQLYVIDRPVLTLQLRSVVIDNELPVYISDDVKMIDIDKHVDNIRQVDIKSTSLAFNVSADNVEIECGVPDLKSDIKLNKSFTNVVIKSKESELNELVGNVYVYEILKFIKKIKINDNEVDYQNELSTTQQIELVESMPVSVGSEIVRKMRSLRKQEIELISSAVLDEGQLIPVDAGIFAPNE